MNRLLRSLCLVLAAFGAAVPVLGAAPVTFSEHIAPIIFKSCSGCHRAGEAAPFTLENYRDIAKRGEQIAKVTASRQMPPWHATSGDFAFENDRRLNPAQIELLAKWVREGMAEGDATKLPPLPRFTAGWQLGQPDLVVKMRKPHAIPAEGRDQYRLFTLPLNLAEDRWVKAIEFRPSAPRVVHHSLFYYDSTGMAKGMDGVAGQIGFRGMLRNQNGVGPLGGWAVGATPRTLPEGMAYRVPRGSDLVLSTHFHPTGKAESEQSTVGIYFAKEAPRSVFTALQLPPAFGALSAVDIPAGADKYTVTDTFEMPVAVEAFGISGHMHYIGRTLEMTATLPDGTVRKLVGIDHWDFSWQEQYDFQKFVSLPQGTRLSVKLTWDNSAANPRNPSHPPRRVRWGPQSEDEMGAITLMVKVKDRDDQATLEKSQQDHARQVLKSSATRAAAGGGGQLVAGLLRANDRNRDGKLARDEAPGWLTPLFARLDSNRDGVLDGSELEAGRNRWLTPGNPPPSAP